MNFTHSLTCHLHDTYTHSILTTALWGWHWFSLLYRWGNRLRDTHHPTQVRTADHLQSQDLNPAWPTPELTFVEWMNDGLSHPLNGHGQSRITPLAWTNFQRGNGGPTYFLGHCRWLSFTMLHSDEDGMVSLPTESCFSENAWLRGNSAVSLPWFIAPRGRLVARIRLPQAWPPLPTFISITRLPLTLT